MKPPVIRKEIDIDAPPERVWPYVATAEGYRRWTCTPAEIHEVVLEPRAGGRFEDRMVVKGQEYYGVGTVVEYNPPREVIFRTRSMHGRLAGLLDTITITLTEQHGGTRVTVEHAGFEQVPPERRQDVFKSFSDGWAAALDDLGGIIAQELLPALGRLLIYQSVEINAPDDRVWRYIGTAEGWLEQYRLRYPAEALQVHLFQALAGGRWETAGVSAMSGDRYRHAGRILTYDPPRLLVMTLREDGWPAETVVTYRLTEYFGKTRVTLIHSGFENLLPQHRERTLKVYEIDRFKSLERLRALVEGRPVEVQYPLFVRTDIEIAASVERVWEYVATQSGSLARHQAETIPGTLEYKEEVLEERVRGRYELRGFYHGTLFQISGRVLAYDPPQGFALSWREDGWPVDTLVTFTLEALGDRTRLTVVHTGFEQLPAESQERVLREYAVGRKRGLEVLRDLMEE